MPDLAVPDERARSIIAAAVPAIEAFCDRWSVRELCLFGSVLRDDFGPDSDIDVLVRFSDDANTSLFDLDEMEDELGSIFGRKVDLSSRRGVEASQNSLRRNEILGSARVLCRA